MLRLGAVSPSFPLSHSIPSKIIPVARSYEEMGQGALAGAGLNLRQFLVIETP